MHKIIICFINRLQEERIAEISIPVCCMHCPNEHLSTPLQSWLTIRGEPCLIILRAQASLATEATGMPPRGGNERLLMPWQMVRPPLLPSSVSCSEVSSEGKNKTSWRLRLLLDILGGWLLMNGALWVNSWTFRQIEKIIAFHFTAED